MISNIGDSENVAKKAVDAERIRGSFRFNSEKALFKPMATFLKAVIM
jgi:hypothetical protein